MDILTGFLSKTLNMTNEQVSDMLYSTDEKGEKALKEDAMDVLLNLDSSRINNIKTKSKEQLDNYHKKGWSESLSKLESDFIQQTNFQSDKKGLELFIEYADVQKNAKTKLSDDEFKLDKRFLDAERSWANKQKEEVDKTKSTYEQQILTYEKQFKTTKLESEIDKYLGGLKIKLPENEKAKINQKNAFINLISNSVDVDFQDDGNHILKKGDARLEDNHGNRIAFPDYIKNQALDFFDIIDETRQNNNNSQNNGNHNVTVPKDEKEYLQKLKECGGDVEKEIALYKLFNNQN